MKRNLDARILQIDETEFPDKPTLKIIAFMGVTTPVQGDVHLDIKVKLEMYRLAHVIAKGGIAEFTAEDVVLIKDRIGKVCANIVTIGRCFDILDADIEESEMPLPIIPELPED